MNTIERTDKGALPPGRVLILFALLGALPLVVLTYMTLLLAGQAMRKQVQLQLQSTSAVTAVFVEQHFSGLAELVDAYAARPQLIHALGDGDLSHADVSVASFHLRQLQRTREGIAAAFISDMQGNLVSIVPETPSILGKNFRARDWYKGVQQTQKPYVSEVYVSMASGNPRVVGVASLIRDQHEPNRPPMGILVVAYETLATQQFTQAFAQAVGVRLQITDQRGVIVAEPSGIREWGLTRHSERPEIAAALRGESGTVESVDSPLPSIVAYAPVPHIGWTVTSSLPLAAAFQPIQRLRHAILVIAGMLFFLLMGGLTVFWIILQQRRQGEVILRREQERVQGILEHAHDAFVGMDSLGDITRWNHQAEHMFGWPRTEVVGRRLSGTIVPAEQREAHERGLRHLLATGEGPVLNRRVELQALRKDGSTLPVEVVIWDATSGERSEFSAFLHDISERKKAQEELSALHQELATSARTDALTCLGNRRRLTEDLETLQARAKRYGHRYCVALLDVDFFKLYNDAYGHLAGDDALRRVAEVIAHTTRSGDGVYRYGGEEILCVYPEQSIESARDAVERLRKAVELLNIFHEAKVPPGVLTISAGVAMLNSAEVTSEEVLLRADKALYQAKQRGRNRVELAEL